MWVPRHAAVSIALVIDFAEDWHAAIDRAMELCVEGRERERDIEIKGKRGLGEGERVGKRAKEDLCVGRGCVCAY